MQKNQKSYIIVSTTANQILTTLNTSQSDGRTGCVNSQSEYGTSDNTNCQWQSTIQNQLRILNSRTANWEWDKNGQSYRWKVMKHLNVGYIYLKNSYYANTNRHSINWQYLRNFESLRSSAKICFKQPTKVFRYSSPNYKLEPAAVKSNDTSQYKDVITTVHSIQFNIYIYHNNNNYSSSKRHSDINLFTSMQINSWIFNLAHEYSTTSMNIQHHAWIFNLTHYHSRIL